MEALGVTVLHLPTPTSYTATGYGRGYEVTGVGDASLVHPVVEFGDLYRYLILGANDVRGTNRTLLVPVISYNPGR